METRTGQIAGGLDLTLPKFQKPESRVPEAGSRPATRTSPIPSWGGPLLLAVLLCVAYRNSFGGPFIFDDLGSIENNPHIRSLWPIHEVFRAPPTETVDFRPIVSLTLALNYAIAGLDVSGYHALNLILHLVAAWTLYGIVRRSLMGARLAARFAAHARGLAFAIAAVWSLHPLLTESVTYVIQRTELLMGVFSLLTLYCVIRGAERREAAAPWYAAAVVCCALGMASKEVMIVVPFVVLVYDRALLSDSYGQAIERRAGLYAGLAASWAVLGLCLQRKTTLEAVGFDITGLSSWEYLLTQSDVIVHYGKLALWPDPLVLDYFDWPIVRDLSEVWGPFGLLCLLALATVWALRWHPVIGLLGAWFLLFLAPTSSVLPIGSEIAAERRMYMPLVPLVVAGVLAVVVGLESGRLRPAQSRALLCVLLGGVLVLAIWGTNRRNLDYRSEISILQDTVRKRPDNPRAHYNLGTELMQEEQYRLAAVHLLRAVQIEPRYDRAMINLGVTLAELGRYEGAIQQFQRALELRPHDAHIYYRWGQVLLHQGRLEEAVPIYRQALALDPEHEEARSSLRWVTQRRSHQRWSEWQRAQRASSRRAHLADGLDSSSDRQPSRSASR